MASHKTQSKYLIWESSFDLLSPNNEICFSLMLQCIWQVLPALNYAPQTTELTTSDKLWRTFALISFFCSIILNLRPLILANFLKNLLLKYLKFWVWREASLRVLSFAALSHFKRNRTSFVFLSIKMFNKKSYKKNKSRKTNFLLELINAYF